MLHQEKERERVYPTIVSLRPSRHSCPPKVSNNRVKEEYGIVKVVIAEISQTSYQQSSTVPDQLSVVLSTVSDQLSVVLYCPRPAISGTSYQWSSTVPDQLSVVLYCPRPAINGPLLSQTSFLVKWSSTG